MAIDLVTAFRPHVDEQFSTESKKDLLTNQDFDWTGAHTIKVYKISTGAMNDYGRKGPAEGNWSRFGPVTGLDATTEEFTLKKDRSFTFAIDKLDTDETAGQLAASQALDDAEVPETGRVLVVTPAVYALMKKCKDIVMETNIGNDLRLKGVIGILDGMDVQKIPANRLPAGFGFMAAHRCATVAPTKLEDFRVHQDPPGISGSLVEGRICYDAFVLDNKKKAIYYQAQPVTAPPTPPDDEKDNEGDEGES